MTNNKSTYKSHSLLPKDAQRILSEAAKAAQKLHGLAKVRAIQAAIERVKRQYPKHFST